MNPAAQIYKTAPLQSWKMAKELRMKHYQEVMQAGETGKLVVSGGTEGFVGLPAGLGNYVYLGGEPYGASIGYDPQFSQVCSEAVESRGFARDLCAYMRNYWGSMFLDRFYFGGKFPKPSFCIQMNFCDSHAKWYQVVSDHYGIPFFSIDVPMSMRPWQSPESRQHYLEAQLHDAIEWMEKTFHRKYDDEKLVEAVKNEYSSTALWGEICLLNRNIPAVLDIKTIFSLYVICTLIRHKREAVQFCKELKSELEYRIQEGIAALATEKCRILDDGQPPWSFLDFYRHMEKYGAICVGSIYAFSLSGNYEDTSDGTWITRKTLEERNISMKSREDAIKLLVELYLDRAINKSISFPQLKIPMMLSLTDEFNCQGVTIHLNRGCELFTAGVMETKIALQNKGIPVMVYEGNMADRREIDERQMLDRLDSFMESLGLSKLEK